MQYEVFDALEESISKNKKSLSGGISILAKKNRIRTMTIRNDQYWIDIDNYESFLEAEKLYRIIYT